jgi:hypothetical protein
MHRFLTAFLCLSTLAMTQNVVAGTPSPVDSSAARMIVQGAERAGVGPMAQASLGGGVVGGEVPSQGTMLLLVTGLAGLSAVGHRSRATKPVPTR